MAKSNNKTKNVFSRADRTRKSVVNAAVNSVGAQLLLFFAFIGAVVFLVTVDTHQRDDSLRSLVIGEPSAFEVFVSREFTFIQKDVVQSKRKRDLAASEVAAVFDWQEGLGADLRDRLGAAFSEMRADLATHARERLVVSNPERLHVVDEMPSDARAMALLESLDMATRLQFARERRKDVFDRLIGVSVRDSDFDAFARHGFQSDAEVLLADIVGQVMTNIIVVRRRTLEDEQERGIFLRRMRGEKVLIEYLVSDIDARFVTMERVPALVEEAGARRLSAIGDRDLRTAILSTANSIVQPNTFINPDITVQKREAAVASVEDQFVREEMRRGQILLNRGEVVTERHRRIIEAMLDESTFLSRGQVVAGVVLFTLLAMVTLFVFGRRNLNTFRLKARDVVFMSSVLLSLLALSRVGVVFGQVLSETFTSIPAEAWYFAIPVAASGMLIRLVLNSEHAAVFTVLFALLVGLMTGNSFFFATYAAIGGFVGAMAARQVRNRMALLWSGLVIGAVNMVSIMAFLLISGEFFELSSISRMGMGLVGGIASGIVVSAVLPVVEAVFGYTTDIKLLELANLNHPGLRELIVRAPGSYHHSMMVGSLCEAAAEAVGGNPLLARVGSYYHDIGKAKNPHYFAENQKLGMNPHDKLKPNMSALVIKAHVKDGLEMARQYRLPLVIQDFIAQHHGTSLIAYFYHKAKSLEDPEIQGVDEKDYRYPGPKPQSRETAICLLADGIEAASRAMPDPTPAKLKGLVQKMINKAFTDGQLDECELTLKDLNLIALAFNRILAGIYHHRPEYPSDKKKDIQHVDRSSEPAEHRGDARRKTTKRNREQDTDANTDVWEMTAERNMIEEEKHAGGHPVGGKGSKTSEPSKNSKSDKKESRESLPRLGSS